jgi:oxygen-independent coproporphyrinogen-3 oxidase
MESDRKASAGLEPDLDRLEALLPAYDRPGPRYTSYPTVPAWSERYGPGDFRRDLGARDPEGPLSLYVHVPFCRSLCHFCACNRVITRDADLPARWLGALEREVGLLRALLAGSPRVVQLHWGGGTPTHLAPGQIERVHGALAAAFHFADDAEQSIEVDPRVTTPEQVETLRRLGFRRISLGVQDVDPRVQEAVHRLQPVEQTAALVRLAREAGFASVGFDLIYGLPYQTEASFARSLDALLALVPDRIALYSYAHVTWVAKQQRGFERKDLPDARTKLRIFVLALRRFLAAGYVHVGMDHFARPDDELARALGAGSLRRNFMGYTTRAGVELLGFGPSAISELDASYAQSLRDLEPWQAAVGAGSPATFRGHRLSDDDRARRFVITRVMCQGEVRAGEFEGAFGEAFARRFSRELEALRGMARDGLVELAADGSLRVTATGRLLVRNVAMVFDAYLPAQERGERPIFSRTV